jgi:hypothetical protein
MKVWVVVATLLILCSIARADRTVWYVHPDSALNSIQAGLDSCADNDIVLVAPGTYHEHIIWPSVQGIHLISELGAESTIIDGDTINRVIEISTNVDTMSVIQGFTIQNGLGTKGAGIYCGIASSPSIIGNIITHNNAVVSWRQNDWACGGGIYCDSISTPVIKDNIISDNDAGGIWGYGGGISCYHSSGMISSNIITNNCSIGFCLGYGGGIYCLRSSPVIRGNTINFNHADGGQEYGGGGICCGDFSSPLIIANIVSNNEGGGGIYCHSSSPIIDSSTISGNSWHGIWCVCNASPIIHHCDIISNQGYGVYNIVNQDPVDAEYNWWGDSTGPYHPTQNPGGLGDTVSDYVDFIPWLYWPGVEDRPVVSSTAKNHFVGSTIFAGPLTFPKDKTCRVFDITGRQIKNVNPSPGVYFIELDGEITQKIIKVK